ncbi:MAG: methylcobamide--CoM methyltransferase, partial [Asgard group archaeon]
MAEEMNPYERWYALTQHKDIDRIPSFNHLASATIPLMHKYKVKWPEAHFDPQMMARLAEASWLECKLEGLCVPFDLV